MIELNIEKKVVEESKGKKGKKSETAKGETKKEAKKAAQKTTRKTPKKAVKKKVKEKAESE